MYPTYRGWRGYALVEYRSVRHYHQCLSCSNDHVFCGILECLERSKRSLPGYRLGNRGCGTPAPAKSEYRHFHLLRDLCNTQCLWQRNLAVVNGEYRRPDPGLSHPESNVFGDADSSGRSNGKRERNRIRDPRAPGGYSGYSRGL